jgi:tRNA(Arg) A34 adenosine deaminase TadA
MEAAMRRAIELAEESVEAGDEPFGTVLVRDGEVVAEARNTVRTDDDVTAHPELKLARWAGREQSLAERRETTMVTSTEPCPMCAGAVRNVGLGQVVYSTSGPALAELLGRDPAPRCAEVVGDETAVEGPLLADAGMAVHESFWDGD